MRGGCLTILALAALCGAVTARPAAAAFPGQNGPLVVALNAGAECPETTRYLLGVPWRGGPGRAITPKCDRDARGEPRDVYEPQPSPDGRTIIARQENVQDEVG